MKKKNIKKKLYSVVNKTKQKSKPHVEFEARNSQPNQLPMPQKIVDLLKMYRCMAQANLRH